MQLPEFWSSHPEVLYELMFLSILQNSEENTSAGIYFYTTIIEKRLQHTCFLVNCIKFLSTPIL